MSENTTLRIHTQLRPEEKPITAGNERERPRLWRRRKKSASGADAPAPSGKTPTLEAFGQKKASPSGEGGAARAGKREPIHRKSPRRRFPLTRRDRLLRNSAVACAALLGVLALGNVEQPWAVKAREGIRQALTMRIDLDDSLGELTFVRSLMPESALVFLNVSGGSGMSSPMDAAISHVWSELQPWTLFEGEGPVKSIGAGTVTAVSPLSGGQYGVLIDHGEGLESVYANLVEVNVSAGDAVNRGDVLGTASDTLYFELRQGGESVDPNERLGL